MEPLKVNFIHMLQLLASAEEQDGYQSEVSGTDIADELRCMWFDDFYGDVERERMVPLLTAEELRRVDEFHAFYESRAELLPRNYSELRESELWAEVRRKAGETLTALGWDKVQTVRGFGAV